MEILTFLEKRLEEVIAGIGVVIMCLMVFFQVVMRYVFSLPTSWSDEIAQYCMLWSVYLSVSWAVRESCLLYTSPSPRDMRRSRMPSSA